MIGRTNLAFDELRLDGRPRLTLCGVTEQVHDNRALADGLVDLEKVLAWDPAVLLGVLPGLSVLSHTDDDIEAVVAEVETLTVALGAVANECESVIFEVVLLEGYKLVQCQWTEMSKAS